MTQSIVQVDAFADGPFTGNPAAVCVMKRPREDRWMQAVAMEMNLSETAFLAPGPGCWQLRWFTPAVEVALCGHATLASAHVLWNEGHASLESELAFETLSGRLTARCDGDWITLDFPAKVAISCTPPVGLAESLGVDPVWVGGNGMDYLVEVASESVVSGAAPDFGKLLQVDARGVMVTARADRPDCDFVSRFFAPAAGVNEDPVTGSAHCCLAPYWAERLQRSAMTGRQLSKRGGVVRVEVRGDRVLLGGQAVTIVRGELSAEACS